MSYLRIFLIRVTHQHVLNFGWFATIYALYLALNRADGGVINGGRLKTVKKPLKKRCSGTDRYRHNLCRPTHGYGELI